MTALELINETFAAYSDPKNRAYNPYSGGCKYITSDGRKCAVGRCLIRPFEEKENVNSLIKCSEGGWIFQRSSFLNDSILFSDELFKEEYRGHSPELWMALQRWHDNSGHFTSEGVSNEGMRVIQLIRGGYDSNKWGGI